MIKPFALCSILLAFMGSTAFAQSTLVSDLFISPHGQAFRQSEPGGDPPLTLWFKHADGDGDTRISKEEFSNDALVFFVSLDANGDDSVTSSEVVAYQTRYAPELLRTGFSPPPEMIETFDGQRRKRKARGPAPLRGAQPYGLLGEIEPVMAADADLSRRVTLEEFGAKTAQRFAKLDADRDGVFVLAEAPPLPTPPRR